MTDIRRRWIPSESILGKRTHVLSRRAREHHPARCERPAIWLMVVFFAVSLVVTAGRSFPYIISETEAFLIRLNSFAPSLTRGDREQFFRVSTRRFSRRPHTCDAIYQHDPHSRTSRTARARIYRNYAPNEREEGERKRWGEGTCSHAARHHLFFSTSPRNPRDGSRSGAFRLTIVRHASRVPSNVLFPSYHHPLWNRMLRLTRPTRRRRPSRVYFRYLTRHSFNHPISRFHAAFWTSANLLPLAFYLCTPSTLRLAADFNLTFYTRRVTIARYFCEYNDSRLAGIFNGKFCFAKKPYIITRYMIKQVKEVSKMKRVR